MDFFFIGPVKVSQRWFVISGSDRAHESTWEMKIKSENSGEGKLSRRNFPEGLRLSGKVWVRGSW